MITSSKLEFVRTDDDGNKWWRVILTADAEPDSLELTGADVADLASNVRFAAGSVLLTPSANYVAYVDGTFSGSGGGGGDNVNVTIINQGSDAHLYYGPSLPYDVDTWTDVLLDELSTKILTVPSGTYIQPPGSNTTYSGDIIEIEGEDYPTYQANGDGTMTVRFE